MPRPLSPPGIRPPFGQYSHGMEILGPARLVVTSGQLGARPDDTIPDSLTGQAEQCFQNIEAILSQAGMTFSDVIRINAFVTKREYFPGYMAVRDRFIGDPPPASTLVIVTGFTRPEFLLEVEVTAAAPIGTQTDYSERSD